MSSDPRSQWPLALWYEVERLCTDYEQALRAGRAVDRAAYLHRVPEAARDALASELAALDAEYARSGEPGRSGEPAEGSPARTRTQPAAETAGSFSLATPGPALPETALVAGGTPTASLLIQHPRYRLQEVALHDEGLTVWRAEDRLTRRPVMVHGVRTAGLPEAALERLRRTIEVLRGLHSPYLPAIYDVEEIGPEWAIVTAAWGGPARADGRAAGRRPSPAAACAAIRDACLGLADLASVGLVHGAIGPASLVRQDAGRTQIVDLLAVEWARIAGTAAGPPQDPAGGPADEGRDLVALGEILAEMLGPPDRWPPRLAGVVDRLRADRPGDRPLTAAQAAAALRPWAVGRRAIGPWRARVGLGAGVGLLAGTMTAVGGWAWSATRSETIVTEDPHVRLVARGGRLVRLVDPLTGGRHDLTGDDLDLREAFRPTGLRVAVGGRPAFLLRRDGSAWVVLRGDPPGPPRAESSSTKSSPAAPSPPEPSGPGGPPAPTDGADVRLGRGLTLDALATWLDRLPAGFVPTDLNAEVHRTPATFNVLAIERTPAVPFRVDFALSDEQVQRAVADNDGKAWGLAVACPYEGPTGRATHQVWVQDGSAWGGWSVPGAEVADRLRTWRGEHLRPVQLHVAVGPVRTGLAGFVLRPDGGVAWDAEFDLTEAQLALLARNARRRGRRPDCLTAYADGTGGGVLYGVTTVADATGGDWSFHQELTSAEFDAMADRERRQGRQPRAVTSRVGPDGRSLATAVFVSPPSRPRPSGESATDTAAQSSGEASSAAAPAAAEETP